MRIINKIKDNFFKIGFPIILTIAAAIWFNTYNSNQNKNISQTAKIINEKGNVSVHFLDVGQGDSELIIDNDKAVLIDAGETDKSSKVNSYLKKYNIKELEAIIATHPHSDHIGGISSQIKNFKVDKLIIPEIPQNLIPTTKCYEKMIKEANDKQVEVIKAQMGYELKLREGILRLLGPIYKNYDNLNLYSIPAKFIYKNTSFLFCGDMEKEAEYDMIESGQDLKSNVFKLNHHGSNSSNTKEFLNKVNADYYVIEVGYSNSYKLPKKSVLNRISDKPIYRTDQNGDIVFLTNGDSIEVKTSK